MSRISRKNWALIWILGMAGQICWNIENSWFNNFVYDRIAPDPSIVSWMVGVSAAVTTFCTFLVGTWSDRLGRRKPFICAGYILWGLFTFLFGVTEKLPRDPLFIAAAAVVIADAVMSFFGSVGNDSGFSAWTTDISDTSNRGKLGGVLAVMPVFSPSATPPPSRRSGTSGAFSGSSWRSSTGGPSRATGSFSGCFW